MPGPDRRRILVVDDDRAFRLSTAELLRQDGYEVAMAENGAEAVAALKAGHFDLMLLDLRMPGIAASIWSRCFAGEARAFLS